MAILTKRSLSILLGFGISIIAIYFIARGIDVGKVAHALSRANYWWLIPNVAVIIFSMYQRAWRWGRMTAPIKKVKFIHLLSSTAIGFMANNILPLRLGEFVRAYALSRQEPAISKSASLAMIFTERIVFDLAALLAIFGVVLSVTTIEIDASVKDNSLMILAVALSGYIFAVVISKWPDRIAAFIGRRLAFLPGGGADFVVGVIQKFALGLQFMRRPSDGLSVMLQTAFIWIFLGLSNYFVFLVFDLALPLEASFATLAIVSIAILLPSSPGFIGVYHAAVIFTLGQYDVDTETAVACAIIMHAAQYVAVTLYGLYHLWRSQLKISDVESGVSD